jgi:predicted permease
VIFALMAASLLCGLAGFLSARRIDPTAWTNAVLRGLFFTGAPLSGIVATSTRLETDLLVGLTATWVTMLGALGAVLLATRHHDGPRRAETLLVICWPNSVWVGFPAVVVLLGWNALPLAIAFSQFCSGPFTQVVIPGTAAALMHDEASIRHRLRLFAANPYLHLVGAGLLCAAVGLRAPGAAVSVAQWGLLAATVPAFAAVGGALAAHRLSLDPGVARLVAGRLAILSLPLLALRTMLPIPAPFVVAAAMSVGMSSFQVAATYRVPTARLASALAVSTACVLVVLAAVGAARL